MNIREIQFETDIEASLLSNGGWTKAPNTYQKELGLDLETLLTFLEKTQPKEMQRYQTVYGENYKQQLVKRLNDEIKVNGMVHVFRNGITDRGMKLKLAYFKPETTLNPKDMTLYQQNIFHYKFS